MNFVSENPRMFPETKSRETLRFEGNKIHCSPRDQSLSDLLHSKTEIPAITCNSGQHFAGNSELFPV